MSDATMFETKNLEHVIAVANNQLDLLHAESENKKEDIIEAKHQLREETDNSFSSLWGSDDFEALVELSQFATQVSDTITSYETVMKKISLLEKLLLSPYFARLDFKFETESDFEHIYIGRVPLMEDLSPLIYDWRSPIAGMFYRFGPGAAYYDAPAGRISGEINLKRQYEIKHGKLEYFFDTDVEILDEFLKGLLSQSASPQMKSIVETIQRDQDLVIRDMENDILMVQGVAGSGKTSIALHRAAYLMYSGLSDRLTSQNIVIISPHTLFERYIDNVLPELGEESVTSILMEDIFRRILKNKRIQTKNKLLESIITQGDSSWTPLLKRSLEYKMSTGFKTIIDKLDLPKNRKIDIIAAYKELFDDPINFYILAGDVKLPDDIAEILAFTKENLQTSYFFYDDAAVITYLQLKHTGYNKFRHIKQVVIDEAQDYYPLHYEIMHILFPNARYTILGDINQTIEKQETDSFYQMIQNTFNKKRTTLISLDKSFRCANEIMQFSAQFVDTEIKAFGRKTEPPEIIKTKKDDYSALQVEIQKCLDAGYKSIGIVCKSAHAGHELHTANNKYKLIKNDSESDLTGVFIIPVYLSKGMEFDAAIIWDVDEKNYSTTDDKKLLYIACTRALHRLTLFYSGEVSQLCKGGADH